MWMQVLFLWPESAIFMCGIKANHIRFFVDKSQAI